MTRSLRKKLHSNGGISWLVAIMLVLIIILAVASMIPTYLKYQEQGKTVACGTALDTARRQLASNFMLKENLRENGGCEADKAIYYMDTASGLESRHDFKVGIPFEESYAKFRARLDRRLDRLRTCLRSGGKVLLVHWFGEGRCRRDETVDAIHRLRAAFPDTVIDLLVVETEKFAKDVAYDEAEPGIVFATGDFYDQSRFDPVVGNEKLALSVLGGIRLCGRWRNLLRTKKALIKKRLLRIFGKKGSHGSSRRR